jgi:diguanylate cyclase (GGDEF)-like protein
MGIGTSSSGVGHLAILVGLLLLALAVGWYACERWRLRHLRELAETARRLGGGDLSARPRHIPARGELGQLASAFSEMAEHLQTHKCRIEYLATRDGLTGLPNRSLLIDQVDRAIALAAQDDQALALAVLDLDRFKFLSDSLGVTAADDLLKRVAECLCAFVPEHSMVAHLGADEFAVLLPSQVLAASAIGSAARLTEVFRRGFNVLEREIHVTASIGIAVYPRDGRCGDALLNHARAAVGQVKKLGGNGVQAFTSTMKAEAVERLKFEQALRHALKEGEFHLHYQPKVELASGRISGMEALLRWHSPELGPVPPVHFIPLAEETGLIIPIGEWVLHTACAQYQAWRQMGLQPPPIAVNVSSRQFWHGNLDATVARILRETGCPAAGLELEVTESVVMRNIDDTAAALARLRRQGITISLDDFGTGYSSLNYLCHLPLNKLKIDRSFLGNLARDPRAGLLIREIVAIAHALDLAVITEGVETEVELDLLLKSGCDEAQGYLFSKPLPAEQLQALFGRQPFLSFSAEIKIL